MLKYTIGQQAPPVHRKARLGSRAGVAGSTRTGRWSFHCAKFCRYVVAFALTFLVQSSAEASVVTVTANPPWQDTGIDVAGGHPLEITATGAWRFRNTDPFFGPEG